MKITLVGGGAHRLLGILRGTLAVPGALAGGEICLYDLAPARAEAMGRMLLKTPEQRLAGCRVSWGLSLEESLTGADAVGVVMPADGLRGFARSEDACLRHGFISSDNVSPTGAMCAVKIAPVILNIARTMERCCPRAWLVNFVNPVAVLSSMVNNHTGIRAMGVCAGFTNHLWDIPRLFGEDAQAGALEVETAGVNHLSFVTSGRWKDRDLFEALRERIGPDWRMCDLQPWWNTATAANIRNSVSLLVRFWRELGVLVFSTEPDGMQHLMYEETVENQRRDHRVLTEAELDAQTAAQAAAGPDTSIRPFKVNMPEDAIVDMRRRIAATRWPDRESVKDRSQGVPLSKMQPLVQYWGTGYDWRKAEAKLNALPQFMTKIDGLDIYFIHVKSREPNAMPLILTHGWPGSIFEFLKVIGPLTDPTAYGGTAADAFDVVIPSMPGYGFSQQPLDVGWKPARIASAWDVLMKRLGYRRYVAQGGDWGAVVTDVMAKQAPPGLLAIHVNMPATIPPDVAKALTAGEPPPAGLSPEEKTAYEQMTKFYTKGSGYGAEMSTRPQTIGYSLADSPSGLAAWFYDKFADWTYSGGDPEKSLTRDEMLDDISLYWLTNTGASAARLYWENNANNFNAVDISIPAAITVFPGEIYQAPKSWAEKAYHKLIYYNRVDKGGHFAAWEEPQLFASELRKAFKSLR